ncbi:MAG TPA: HAMP domain-containing sensor histidine kinase [Gaiella sp.]
MIRADAERLRVVAHELRSPVAALTALAEAVPAAEDPEVLRRMLALAIAAARDVERIVSDPEHFSLRREPIDLAALAVSFATPVVTVETNGEARALGDETRLRQALSNLVANALRHGTHVVVEVTEAGGLVAVDVTDDGPGIAPGIDPFARGTSAAGSSGYGLWLARGIAEAHGGRLELVDAPGRGARLRLSLPSSGA